MFFFSSETGRLCLPSGSDFPPPYLFSPPSSSSGMTIARIVTIHILRTASQTVFLRGKKTKGGCFRYPYRWLQDTGIYPFLGGVEKDELHKQDKLSQEPYFVGRLYRHGAVPHGGASLRAKPIPVFL